MIRRLLTALRGERQTGTGDGEPGGMPFPYPLLHPEKKLLCYWMPRCGTTSVTAWFMEGLGRRDDVVLRAAELGFEDRPYAEQLHPYRDLVWNRTLTPALVEAAAADPGYHRCVLVRDPFQRLVSSYTGYMQGAYDYFREVFGVAMSDEEIRREVSFRRFVELLGEVDLATCEVHVRLQTALPCWAEGYPLDQVLRTETLDADLAALSERFGLPPPQQRHLARSKDPSREVPVDLSDLGYEALEAALRVGDRVVFPPSERFYDAALLEGVHTLYRDDIERLGYAPPELLP